SDEYLNCSDDYTYHADILPLSIRASLNEWIVHSFYFKSLSRIILHYHNSQ
ncbi:unnamed protein product, partial [Schistosoma turkestanicum]